MTDNQNSKKNSNNNKFNPWGKHPLGGDDERLISGPRRRMEDLRMLANISLDFIRGFRAFYRSGPCITFFGSARFYEQHKFYTLARETSKLLARSGLTIMTGGGPGIMEAANRGAQEVSGKSVGCNIELDHEQSPNSYLDKFVEFDYFFVRKVMLLRYSYGFIVFPGGFGTLDEVFETVTLMQTKKISNFPIVMMGIDYWQPMRNFINTTLLKNKTISSQDTELLFFCDDPYEASQYILKFTKERFGLKNSLLPSKKLTTA